MHGDNPDLQVATALRASRTLGKWTMREMAEKLGVYLALVQRWMGGSAVPRSDAHLASVAQVTGISVSVMRSMAREDEKTRKQRMRLARKARRAKPRAEDPPVITKKDLEYLLGLVDNLEGPLTLPLIVTLVRTRKDEETTSA